MPIIIDGHNIIPKIPGLELSAVDDEMQLVEMLQEFCRISRKKIEVYFDKAPPGHPRSRQFGSVTAHFIREGYTADHAIRDRLYQLKRAASSWTVVSSDRQVQSNARAFHADVYSAERFAAHLLETLFPKESSVQTNHEISIPAGDIDDWLRLFGIDEE